MKKNILVLVFALIFQVFYSQSKKQPPTWLQDTMGIPGTEKILDGEYLETTLKNLSVVRFFRTHDNHYYLRFIVTRNFYFGKTDVLEIRSGSKSYYAKNITQHKVTKTSGLYLVEVFPNYLATLKQEGISGLIFNKAETDFSRQDAHQIRAIASVFYDKIEPQKR